MNEDEINKLFLNQCSIMSALFLILEKLVPTTTDGYSEAINSLMVGISSTAEYLEIEMSEK